MHTNVCNRSDEDRDRIQAVDGTPPTQSASEVSGEDNVDMDVIDVVCNVVY